MSNTRNTGFLGNVVKVDSTGNVSFVSGSTTLMSISSSGAVTTTGVISGSNALSSSYAVNADQLDNLDSTSFVFTSSFNTYSSSMSTRVTNNESTGSTLTTASASFAVVSSSYSSASGSLSTRVTRIEGNYATTGSNVFLGAQTVCANITSTGTIIAQTLNVQQVTSSVVYSSGSNIFGCSLTNTQQFTGSVLMTGSLTVTTAGTSPEFQVAVGGTTIGNALTDVHQVTGSLRMTGSNALFNVGCVGVNTSSPNFRLHVSTGDTTSITQPTAGTYGLYVQQNTNGSTGGLYIQDGATNTGKSIYVADNNGCARFVVDQDGSVGIGTCSPGAKLEIVGATIINPAVCAGTSTYIQFSNSGSVAGYIGSAAAINSGAASSLALGVSSGAGITVTSNGDVAVGAICTTNTNTKLKVKMSSEPTGISLSSAGFVVARTATDTQLGIGYYSTPDAWVISSTFGSTGAYKPLVLATSDTERIRITTDGISCFACQVCSPRLVVEQDSNSEVQFLTLNNKNCTGASVAARMDIGNWINQYALTLGRNGICTTGTRFGDNQANTTFIFDNAVSSCGMYIGLATSTGNLNLITAGTKKLTILPDGSMIFNCNGTYCSNYGYNFLCANNGTILSGAHVMGNMGAGTTCATPLWCLNGGVGGAFRMEFNWSSGAETQWINHNNCVPFKLVWSADGYANKYCFNYNGTFWACNTICAPAGVKFGNGSSTLNYYEQGTWTPRVTNGSFTTNAGTENAGWYVRVGNIVTVGGTLSWSGGSGAQDGNSLQIRCLPFTANSGTHYRNVGQFGAPAIDSIGFKNACAQMTLVIDPGSSYIYIIQNYQNGTYLTYTHSPCMANAGTVYGFQATYQV